MGNPLKTIYCASRKVLSIEKYFNIFLISSFLFLGVLIFLPVFIIPENDLSTQLRILTPLNYLLMIFLALSMGLMISMQIYSSKIKKSLKETGRGVIGGFSGIVAGIFGTASCASCVAVIFGFLGFGTVLFLLEYQNYVVGISILLIYFSIYLTSSGIEKGCAC